MNPKLAVLAVSAVLGISAGASAGVLSKEAIKMEHNRIAAELLAQKRVCDSRSGNAKDICMAEAKGNEKVSKAELDARDADTVKSKQAVLIARAEASYDVAMQRCDDLAGNPKDVCKKDANAALTKAKVNAVLARETAQVQASAADRIGRAEEVADKTKREADFKAARERCDALAGNAKGDCVARAKSTYGM